MGRVRAGAGHNPAEFTSPLAAPRHELHHHAAARQPQLRRRARRAHPARGHPPGHRPALWLPRRRLRLVQEQAARRPRDPRRAPAQGLSVAEEEAGFVLTCCAMPQTDCVVEARSVPGAGEYPVLKLPSRVLSIDKAGARRGRAAPATAGQPEPAVPRRAVRGIHPAAAAPGAATAWPMRRTTWAARRRSNCTCATCPAANSPTMSSAP